jgi:NADPH:quinone reductase-like Zn-dependent oxidoreductase
MKAAVIESYGGPEVFKLKEIPDPELKSGEILVRNLASSVNPIDTHVRQGLTKLVTGLKGDHVIGSDFSGTVLTSQNGNFKEGDEVFGFVNAVSGGAYAEYVTVSEANLYHKPAGISFTEAASLPLVGCTAWQGMVKDGGLDNGDKVLVLGCTGGVGTAAVQIAKSFEAEVYGTCSKDHVDFARELGCKKVWAYENEEVAEEEKFDLIFDASGKFTISDYKDNLSEDGVFVSTRGGADSFSGAVEAIKDFALKSQMKLVMVMPNPEDLKRIKIMVEEGWLKPFVAETFGLHQLQQAHQMVEKGGFIGKIAVEIV